MTAAPAARSRRLLAGALVVALLAGACGVTNGTPIPTFPPVSFGSGTTTAAAQETSRLVFQALAGQGVQAEVPPTAYRPAESPALAQAPRLVLQADLPDDPQHGYIVIYEFRDATTADGAAREQALYVASGIGGIQFPPDSSFVIRTVGATVIFYNWTPSNAPDPQTPRIETALETVGTGIPVPR